MFDVCSSDTPGAALDGMSGSTYRRQGASFVSHVCLAICPQVRH